MQVSLYLAQLVVIDDLIEFLIVGNVHFLEHLQDFIDIFQIRMIAGCNSPELLHH